MGLDQVWPKLVGGELCPEVNVYNLHNPTTELSKWEAVCSNLGTQAEQKISKAANSWKCQCVAAINTLIKIHGLAHEKLEHLLHVLHGLVLPGFSEQIR